MTSFELTPDFFEDDRNVAVYRYHVEGVEGLKKLKEQWLKEGKSERLIGFVEGLMAVRGTDASAIVP